MKIFKGPKRPYRSPRRRLAGKSPMTLVGGPFDLKTVRMGSTGTLPIMVGGQVGHYNAKNQWVPA